MTTHFAALLAVLLLFGCNQSNSNYDADARACTTDQACSGTAKPVCLDETCVQCTAEKLDACTTEKPICGGDNSCRACSAHAECATSKACLPSGACGDAAQVAYVAAGPAPGGNCDQATPCRTLEAALLTGRPFIKVLPGTIKDNKPTLIEGREVTILAEKGAILDRDGDGAILEIRGRSGTPTKVEIHDLEITGSSTGDGITISPNGNPPLVVLNRVKIYNNQGVGVLAIGGKLNVYRSRFNENSNGGISLMNTDFSIIGNFFYNNGGNNRTTGGISINTNENAANRLEFNSFYLNQSQNNQGVAINCNAGAFVARNNILFNNTTGSNTLQAGGTCEHQFSLIEPGAMPIGANNFAGNPKFSSATPSELTLAADSPALKKADPTSDLRGEALIDINGDLRIALPADIGADQVSKM